MLKRLGLPLNSKFNKFEWATIIRVGNTRSRLFSDAFVEEERGKLAQYRHTVRDLLQLYS